MKSHSQMESFIMDLRSCYPWNATARPPPERQQINNLTSTCWQVWISLLIRLSSSLVLLIRLLRLESKACCKTKLKIFHSSVSPSSCKLLNKSWRSVLRMGTYGPYLARRGELRRGYTRLPLDGTGYIWSLISVEPPSPPCVPKTPSHCLLRPQSLAEHLPVIWTTKPRLC